MKTIITEIPGYNSFYKGRYTVDIGYPWLTFGAIMALEKILMDSGGKFRVLELGSGGSTIFFDLRCEGLLSLETDPEWAKIVVPRLTKTSSSLILDTPRGIRKIIRELPDESFDLVLVDCCAGGYAYLNRGKALFLSAPKVKKGGWLVVDNYEHMTFDYSGYDVYTFDMFRYSGRGTKVCKKL